MIAIVENTPEPEPERETRQEFWSSHWVVAVTMNRARVIYACVPAVASARILHTCAIERGYRDATVEPMSEYMRKHGSASAKAYLAAMRQEAWFDKVTAEKASGADPGPRGGRKSAVIQDVAADWPNGHSDRFQTRRGDSGRPGDFQRGGYRR